MEEGSHNRDDQRNEVQHDAGDGMIHRIKCSLVALFKVGTEDDCEMIHAIINKDHDGGDQEYASGVRFPLNLFGRADRIFVYTPI